MATGELNDAGRGLLSLSGNPVFLYHGLTAAPARKYSRRVRKYWVPLARFQNQLLCFREQARRVVLLTELWSARDSCKGGAAPFVLTFDDGRISNYEIAFPLLVDTGLKAEFFVNTSTVGTKGYLSWQQMHEMTRAGMSFQSHGHAHVDLARLPLTAMWMQLTLSKVLLEDKLGRGVEFLAVPYGHVSPRVAHAALESGYRAVCTSWSWPTQPGSTRINRVAIYSHTSPWALRKLLAGSVFSYAVRSARALTLTIPKRLVSPFWQPREGVIGLGKVL